MNSNNPNRGYFNSPPSITPETRVMPAADQSRQSGKRRGGQAGTALAVFAVAAMFTVLGAGGTYVAFDLGYVEAPAPQSCLDAVDYADELNVMSEEYSDLVGHAMEAAFSFDEDQVAAVEVEGEAFAERYASALAAYEDASAQCRTAGGDL